MAGGGEECGGLEGGSGNVRQAWSRGQEQDWDVARRPRAGWVGASWSCDLGGACPSPGSCCSQLGQKKGERGRDPLHPSSLAQAPTSTSISMEHGHIQVSGASVSLEAVVSVVSRRAVSNQDVVPGNAGAPIREGCDGVLWRWGACEYPASHTWDGSEGAPGCVAEDTGAEAAEQRPRWPRRGEPAAGCLPLMRRPLPSPEAAAAPLAVLVLGPARPGAAHRGDGGGAKGDADEAALLEEGRVVVGTGPLGR